jgi:hypothetical protein
MDWWQKIKLRLRRAKTESEDNGLSGGFTSVKLPGGGTVLLDGLTREFLTSEAPEPSQAMLDGLLERTHRVRIYSGGVAGKTRLGQRCLIDTCEPGDLEALRAAIAIKHQDGKRFHCMCVGDHAMEFLDETGTVVALIGLHHGQSIRWDAWCSDARFRDRLRLLCWLAEHGVNGPLSEYEDSKRAAEERVAAFERWQAATPGCLMALMRAGEIAGIFVPCVPNPKPDEGQAFARAVGGTSENSLAVMLRALESSYPDVVERVRSLLSWNGSGVETSFDAEGNPVAPPSYQGVPENLLARFPIADISDAVLFQPSPSSRVTAGAARFFASDEFKKANGEMAADNLPDDVKRVLIKYWERLDGADGDAPNDHSQPRLF